MPKFDSVAVFGQLLCVDVKGHFLRAAAALGGHQRRQTARSRLRALVFEGRSIAFGTDVREPCGARQSSKTDAGKRCLPLLQRALHDVNANRVSAPP